MLSHESLTWVSPPKEMLEYTKTVLKKVSFDSVLFSKEVKKAINILLPCELEELRDFVKSLALQHPELQQSLIYLKP